MSFGFGLGFPKAALFSGANAPSLSLQLIGTETLDPRITFTRASSATSTDSTGVLRRATYNLLTYSVWSGASGGSPGTAPTSWTIGFGTGAQTTVVTSIYGSADGSIAVRFDADATERIMYQQSVSVTSGVQYALSAELEQVSGSIGDFLLVTAGTATVTQNTFVTNPTTAGRKTILFTATATGTVNIRVGVGTSAGVSGTCFATVSRPQLEAASTAGPYYATTTAANGAPRFDYDPTVFTQQNLLTYSEQFNNAAWVKDRASITANATVAPDGTLTADRWFEDTNTNTHRVNQSVNSTVNTNPYTITVYAKKDQRTKFRVSLVEAPTFNRLVESIFDLDAGTAGAVNAAAGAAGSAAITNVGNGWYRCSVTATLGGTDSQIFCNMVLVTGTNTVNYTGDGTSGIYIWGAQLNTGSTALPYLATTASAQTICAPRGLLIEEQRTNSIRNNTMQGAVAGTPGTLPTNWFVTGSAAAGLTQTVVGTGTANGITYIDLRFNGTPSAGPLNIVFDSPAVAASAGQSWALSTFIAIVGGTTSNTSSPILRWDEGSPAYLRSVTAASISSLPTSLTRYSGAATIGASTTVINSIYFQLTCSAAPIDITLRIGLPQLEQGAFATSVIPTTTAAATRLADSAVMTGSNFSSWYNATASTLYTEFSSPVPATVTASAVVAGYDDGTANNRFSNFYTSNTGALAANQLTGGATNFTISAASGLTLSGVQKQATRFQAGSYASSANGAAAVTDSFASAPPAVNTLRFGLRPSGTQANMWLRRVVVYPSGLPNATLQALTA